MIPSPHGRCSLCDHGLTREEARDRSHRCVSTVAVKIRVVGNPGDAIHVVDALLDAGILQDAINDHDADAGPLRVESAVATISAPARSSGKSPATKRVPRPGGRPYTYDDEIADALRAAGLPVRPCGLNADWSVRAWHLGPTDHHPNHHDGDVYLLDDESPDAQTFSVVRYYPIEGEGDGEVSVFCSMGTLAEAIERAGELVRADAGPPVPPYSDARTLATAVLGLGSPDELPPEIAAAARRVLVLDTVTPPTPADDTPPCAKSMGCLCAFHTRYPKLSDFRCNADDRYLSTEFLSPSESRMVDEVRDLEGQCEALIDLKAPYGESDWYWIAVGFFMRTGVTYARSLELAVEARYGEGGAYE